MESIRGSLQPSFQTTGEIFSLKAGPLSPALRVQTSFLASEAVEASYINPGDLHHSPPIAHIILLTTVSYLRLPKDKYQSQTTMDQTADDVASKPPSSRIFGSARPHHMVFNRKVGGLFMGVDSAFADNLAEDGSAERWDPHENRIKSAIRSAAVKMQKEDPSTWQGVTCNDAKSMATLAKSINETWKFEYDDLYAPPDSIGDFKLSLHVTKERGPRLGPRGWIGRYQTITDGTPDVVISRVEAPPRSGRYQISNINVVVDATVLDKATNKTVYLKQSTVRKLARDFAEIVPFVYTDLENLTKDTVDNARYTADRSVMSLATSAICRHVDWRLLPDDVEDVLPSGSQRTGEPITELTPDMEGLGRIPVTFVPFYGYE